MHKLKEYLFYKKISITQFAKELGVSRIHMSRVCRGVDMPSLLLAKAIERVTNSEVTADYLMEYKAA
jgi:transcriptional regulator with XRE-family HTH domain